ncbi:MAG: nucleotidyltransferase family protein [Caulobacteraceae bacterium]|nr:nucleotidyltransferase family protein [Caulobacteraceae bacterium]
MTPEHVGRLEAIVRASPRVMTVLEGLREVGLPEHWLVSGGVYQTVWNALTGRDADYGIKDYDAVYYDPDNSWDAEDVWIRRVAAHFAAPLCDTVEVRNQARVHLWFEAKFGEPYAELHSAAECLERFVCPAFSVGVRLAGDDRLEIAAPFGLDDVFAMRLRPNPNRPLAAGWDRVTSRAKDRWPEAVIEGP